MFVADTCSFVSYFESQDGKDVDAICHALKQGQLFASPIVITELLSNKISPTGIEVFLSGLPRLAFTSGFWERAGELRRHIRSKGLKANLADALIAQSCIDHDATLITRDRDFRHYVELGGLKLA